MPVLATRLLEGAGRLRPLSSGSNRFFCALSAALLASIPASAGEAVGASDFLTLEQARERARITSPRLAAARETIAAARGEERQAGAFPNPVFGYERDQTFRSGEMIEEDVALIEQPVEIGGQRGLRREVARRRRTSAEAALRVAEIELDFEVTRAFAQALAADERASQTQRAAEAFVQAREASRQRRRAGDVSGYDDRRLALEVARYEALRAQARSKQRAARLALAESIESPERMRRLIEAHLQEPPDADPPSVSLEELLEIALAGHPRLRAAEAEAAAADSAARLAGRGWVPTPVIGAGYKREHEAGTGSFEGYVAAISLPLPLWDRGQGDREAAEARARRAQADLRRLRRRVVQELDTAWTAYHAAADSLAALMPHLGREASAAVDAARMSYAEGEIRLIEWLDAVRAYQEAAATYADVRAEVWIQHATLQRAAGVPLE